MTEGLSASSQQDVFCNFRQLQRSKHFFRIQVALRLRSILIQNAQQTLLLCLRVRKDPGNYSAICPTPPYMGY